MDGLTENHPARLAMLSSGALGVSAALSLKSTQPLR